MAELPRMPLLAVRPRAFDERGMHVEAAMPGTMAEEAGIERGDTIVAIDDAPVRSPSELRSALRSIGERTTIAIERAGQRIERTIAVRRRPNETIEGHDVIYGEVMSNGARLRTIVTRPRNEEKPTAIFFVQGLSCASIDFGIDASGPIAQLIHGLAHAGFVTMRVEKRGVGDSDGEGCETTDFATEVEDVRAALGTLSGCERVIVVGHSVGGMIAPLLDASGYVVIGTYATRWLDGLERGARRQLSLRGKTGEELDRAVAREMDRYRTLEVIDGRSAAFHRQLHDTDLAHAWQKIDRPVLVVHGEYDWVVGEDEARAITTLASNARMKALPRIDHLMTAHDDLAASLRAYGNGRFETRIVEEIAAFAKGGFG